MRDFRSEVIGGTNERIVTASTSSVRSLRVRRIARSDWLCTVTTEELRSPRMDARTRDEKNSIARITMNITETAARALG